MKRMVLCSAVLLVLFGQVFATDLVLKPREAGLRPGQGLKFEWALFLNGQPVSTETATATWHVSPQTLGTITDDGFFIAAAEPGEGVVQLDVALGVEQLSAQAKVTVGKPTLEQYQITVKPEKAVLAPGEKETFTLLVQSADGVALVTKSIRWLVEPITLGSIRQDGLFTAGRNGEGKIIAVVDIKDHLYKGVAAIVISQPAKSVIQGQVTDDTLQPMANAVVSATRIGVPEFSRKTESNAKGEYLLDTLMPGPYIIKAEKEGFLAEYYSEAAGILTAKPVRLAVADTAKAINFTLSRGAGISGVVKEAGTGTPLAGAHVWAVMQARGSTRYHAVTLENGTYALTGLPNGTYIVYAQKEGYIIEVYKESKRQDQATPVAAQAPNETGSVDFTLDAASAIIGVISSDQDGGPVANAVVSILPVTEFGRRLEAKFRGTTNEKGEYLIQVVAGRYIVRAQARGFADEYYNNVSDPVKATPVDVAAAAHVKIDMSLAPFGRLAGTVVDAITGQPIADAKVQLFNENRSLKRYFETTSAQDGSYTFASLPADEYIVVAAAADYLPEYWQEADSIRNAARVSIENNKATTGIAFTLSKGATLKGTVLQETDKTAVKEAFVTIVSANNRVRRMAKTGDDGSWVVSGLSAGTYYAMAAAAGFVPEWYDGVSTRKEAAAMDVKADEEKTGIDFSLAKIIVAGSSISGVVKDESNELPIQNATVVAMPVNRPNRPHRAVTDADGRFEITGLTAGSYVVLAGAKHYIAEYYDNTRSWKKAQVFRVDGTTDVADINFALAVQPMGGYMIAGKVSTRNGETAGFSLVVISAQGTAQAAAICEEDGQFLLSQIPGDRYDVSASTPGYEDSSLPASAPVTVGSGANVYDATITMIESSTTAVTSTSAQPAIFALEQNYPNPFNPTTDIRFSLPGNARVQLRVFNVLGKAVKTLYDGRLPAGEHVVRWDGTNDSTERMASGIYVYRLEAQSEQHTFQQSKRMILIK